MTYAKFDDRCPEHPKIAALSDREFRGWFEMVCYCARNLTDGFIPARIARQQWPTLLQPLQDREVLEVTTGGFAVHDYLEWNDSKQAVEQRRERARRGGYGKAASIAASTLGDEPQVLPSSRTRTTTEVQDQELPPAAGDAWAEVNDGKGWIGVPNGWNDDQASLIRKLFAQDPNWSSVSPSGLNRLNRQYGKAIVTNALRDAWEEVATGATIANLPYPFLESICKRLAEVPA